MKIAIHPLTADPTAAWRELSQHQKVVKINAKLPTNEAPSDKLRVVCMSDTHSLTPFIKFDVPAGDVFIHAGDFTKCGSLQEVVEFNNWIGNLPHKHKIVIAGNHELSFDPTFTHPFSVHTSGDHQKHTGTSILDDIPTLGMSKDILVEAIKTTNVKDYLTNCTYLEDSEIIVHGIKIYGTPWQPEFCKWAFNVPRGEACLSKWEMIPSDTDILVTHTPPVGHGDLCCTGVRAGCVELLSTVQNRVKPKYHVFGHIHEGMMNIIIQGIEKRWCQILGVCTIRENKPKNFSKHYSKNHLYPSYKAFFIADMPFVHFNAQFSTPSCSSNVSINKSVTDLNLVNEVAMQLDRHVLFNFLENNCLNVV